MKHLILGLLLLALILGLCLWSGAVINGRFSAVIAPLERAQRAARQGHLGTAKQLEAEAFSVWEQNYRSFAAWLDHNDIDDVTLAFASLEDAQAQDYLSACSALISMLKNLEEADLLTVHNLL